MINNASVQRKFAGPGLMSAALAEQPAARLFMAGRPWPRLEAHARSGLLELARRLRISSFIRSMMLVAVSLGTASSAAQPGAETCPPKYYVMRHLDRVDGVDSLSPRGFERAERLAIWFKDQPLSTILSLHFARTIQTARPTAEARGLAIQTFGSTNALIAALKTEPTPALAVVHGHSVPVVVAAMTKKAAGDGFGFGRVWVIDCDNRMRVIKPFEMEPKKLNKSGRTP